ncbi:MAG: hypothetical protein WDZ27_04190 [Waddliaceae bacterium]
MKKIEKNPSLEALADALLDALSQKNATQLEECLSRQKLQFLKEQSLKSHVDKGFQVLLDELNKNMEEGE